MQQLLGRIQNIYPELSAAQKTVAAYVLKNYKRVPFYTVTALAEELGVSDTTIIKFCIRLGLSGYGELKRRLAGHLEKEVTTFDRMEQAATDTVGGDLLGAVLAAEQRNLQATLSAPGLAERLEQLHEMLLSARRIWVMGYRASAMAAEYLALSLSQQGLDVRSLSPGAGTHVDAAAAMKKEDLLLVFTFNRYSREMTRTIEYAAAKQVPCVIITDQPGSPCCHLGALVFRCETRTLHYNSSMTGCMGLVNAIIAHTAQDRPRVEKHLQQLEEAFREHQMFCF